jgi:hypothetical protein
MPNPYEDERGNIVVREDAGGAGGGATSSVVRPAHDHEVRFFHDQRVAAAEANVIAAEQHLDAVKKAHPVLGNEAADREAKMKADTEAKEKTDAEAKVNAERQRLQAEEAQRLRNAQQVQNTPFQSATQPHPNPEPVPGPVGPTV